MNRLQILILSLCWIPVIATAQQIGGNELNNDIVVIKGYKPILAEARKISDTPMADTASFDVPRLNYNIEPKQLPSAYSISPIKAVKIKDENIKKLYRGYLEAGYGLQNTLYGDLYYNALRSKEFNAGIHLRHLSSAGNLNGFGFPGNSGNLAEINGKKFLDHSAISAEVGYQRDLCHYYGYDAESTIFSKKETEHVFNNISGAIKYESLYQNHDELEHQVGLNFYNLSDNFDSRESKFGLNTMFGKNAFSGYAHGDIKFSFLKFSESLHDLNRGLVTFAPRYDFESDPWKFSVGLNVDVESEKEGKLYLFPFAKFDYTLAEKSVIVFGELSGGIRQNSFRDAAQENPFLATEITLRNTNMLHNLKFGTNIRIDNDMHFNAWINFSKMKNEMFFENNFTADYPVTFSPVYSGAMLTAVHGELGYEHNSKINAWVKADYFGYTQLDSAVEKPWHVSPFVFTLSLDYNISDKIIFKTDWFIHSSTYYKTYDTTNFGILKGWADVNVAFEYRYTKVLSLFLNLNNVGFSKYRQWYNYPTYRFTALAGLTYSFQ